MRTYLSLLLPPFFSALNLFVLRRVYHPSQAVMAIFRTSTLFHLSFTVLSFAISSRAYVNYANDFIDPNYVLSKNFSATTIPAQQTILSWAEQSIVGGPWSE